jgi:drug/metabolite transporter (DMT)-like permease
MKKNNSIYYFTVVALVLLVGGIYFIKTNDNPQGLQRVLPYICFGLGCSFFGHGMGEILTRLAIKNNPIAAKQLEIDKKDERNLAIANQAKAKAYDMMVIVFGALILAFSLMDIDLIMLLPLVIAYMFFLGYNSYYRVKFYKEM